VRQNRPLTVVTASVLAPLSGWLTLLVTAGFSVGFRLAVAVVSTIGVVSVSQPSNWGENIRREVGTITAITAALGFSSYYALLWLFNSQYSSLLFLASFGFFVSAVYGPGRDSLASETTD